MSGLALGRFDVVAYSREVIRTVNAELQIPAVVDVRHPMTPVMLSGAPSCQLRALFLRDGGRCQYTGRLLRIGADDLDERASIDHVVPLSQGGLNTWENVVLASSALNSLKSDLSLDALQRRHGLCLLTQPWRPRGLDLLHMWLATEAAEQLPEEWQPHLHLPEPAPQVQAALLALAA